MAEPGALADARTVRVRSRNWRTGRAGGRGSGSAGLVKRPSVGDQRGSGPIGNRAVGRRLPARRFVQERGQGAGDGSANRTALVGRRPQDAAAPTSSGKSAAAGCSARAYAGARWRCREVYPVPITAKPAPGGSADLRCLDHTFPRSPRRRRPEALRASSRCAPALRAAFAAADGRGAGPEAGKLPGLGPWELATRSMSEVRPARNLRRLPLLGRPATGRSPRLRTQVSAP